MMIRMVLCRVPGSVQGTYQTSNPVDLVFLEPNILLKEKPLLHSEQTRRTEQYLLRLMAEEFKFQGCKQEMRLSDVIPVSPLPICVAAQLAQSSQVRCAGSCSLPSRL